MSSDLEDDDEENILAKREIKRKEKRQAKWKNVIFKVCVPYGPRYNIKYYIIYLDMWGHNWQECGVAKGISIFLVYTHVLIESIVCKALDFPMSVQPKHPL